MRVLKWTGAVIAALVVLLVLFIALFDWNRLKGPISRKVHESTGRDLVIEGNVEVKLRWPLRVRVEKVRFANPEWAKEPQMVSLESGEASVSLWPLFARKVYLPEVILTQPVVFLEQKADGRKSWAMDLQQSGEGGRFGMGRVELDRGRLGYDDEARKISVRADVSTNPDRTGIDAQAKGTFKGESFAAKASGGPVLALRDEKDPYPLKAEASFGKTGIKAEGTVTSLATWSALDLKVDLKGESLDQLFPLIGLALPATHAYSTSGQLVHEGQAWRYRQFLAKIGQSDLGGSIDVDTAGERPQLRGDLVAKVLDFEDLGPLIGTSKGGTPPKKPAGGKVLPEIPFNTERWDTVDADVKIRAQSIRRAKDLPLDAFTTHLVMKDRKLTLDPLNFGVAGGTFASRVSLDGRRKPIAAEAKIDVNKISLSRLLPASNIEKKASVGRVDGVLELKGTGDSVSRMLATSNGKAALVIAGGEVSNMMLELVGIDLWEMLKFKIRGDQPVNIRCGVFDAGVRDGKLNTNVLVLDTEDTKVSGRGSLDFDNEKIDLLLEPEPKDKSPISLRTPIHVRGPLSKPDMGPDKGKLVLKGLGALALGAVNPLLALGPLIESGPGTDSDCGKLIADTKATGRERVPEPKR